MRIIITVTLFLVISIGVKAQRIVPIANGRVTDTGYIIGSLKVDSVLVFPNYRTTNTNMVLGFDSRGKAVLRINNDSLIYATRRYVDSGFNAITAGSVDSSIYSTVNRLYKITDSTFNIIDSNNAIIYGSLSDLYDTKADKDTLGNFVLKDYLDSTLAGYVDTVLLNDSLQSIKATYVPYTGATGNVDIGTHTITAKDGVFNHSSGSGTALSVTKGGAGEALTVNKTSGSGNAMSVTGGVTQLSELHTTTPIADAYIASAATWNAKGNGTVTSIQLVGGTNVTITPTTAITTSGVYTISATGGGGGSPVLGTPYQLLFPTGTDTLKTTDKAYIDTTDNRLVFANDTTTTTVNVDPYGGTKYWSSNRMGMAALRMLDTVSIPAALQRAINAQTASLMFPVFPGIVFTNNYLYTGMLSTVGTPSYVVAAYNSTIQHLNWNKYLLTTASGANSNALIRTTGITNSAGIICGNTKFSGGGGRGTFMFSLPTYLSTERIMIGYVGAGVAAISADPSTMVGSTASLLLIKDAADATLSFMHTNTSGGAATKVNTGITPNSEDVYRLTVYIAPNSTFYMQLEVLSKSAATRVVTINPTTNIPPVGSRMVSYQGVNNGSVGGVVSYGIIQVMEEIY